LKTEQWILNAKKARQQRGVHGGSCVQKQEAIVELMKEVIRVRNNFGKELSKEVPA
jgi:hypothetical protein